jgi:hypothetical protein
VDEPLPDLGDVFEGVFQPCMALLSTRTDAPGPTRPWALERPDLDAVGSRLLARLAALPKVPAELFGERGYQTVPADAPAVRETAAPEPPWTVALREGIDLGEMIVHAPRLFADPRRLHGRLRDDFDEVGVLIRQTARYPIAALADGLAFRNSILAGFATARWPAAALALYLNATAARWYHFHAHRDARQGMPQVKIAHLRALPDLPAGAIATLAAMRAMNGALRAEERSAVDAVVEDALGLSEPERALVRGWMRQNPLPKSRRGGLPRRNAGSTGAGDPLS